MLVRDHPRSVLLHQDETVARRENRILSVRGARKLVLAGIDDAGPGRRGQHVRPQFDPQSRAGGLLKVARDAGGRDGEILRQRSPDRRRRRI